MKSGDTSSDDFSYTLTSAVSIERLARRVGDVTETLAGDASGELMMKLESCCACVVLDAIQ